MKVPKMFRSGGRELERKIEEFLTKKTKHMKPYGIISMLQFEVVKDDLKYYITYEIGEQEPHVETGSVITIVQPDIKIEGNWLRDSIKFSDSIRDYHGNARGTSVGPKNREENKGCISKIYLRYHLTTKELMSAIRDFYPGNVEDIKVLKLKYKQ